MRNYISKSTKSKSVQKIINEALDILEGIGIPFEGKTERDLEKMAMSFLSFRKVIPGIIIYPRLQLQK